MFSCQQKIIDFTHLFTSYQAQLLLIISLNCLCRHPPPLVPFPSYPSFMSTLPRVAGVSGQMLNICATQMELENSGLREVFVGGWLQCQLCGLGYWTGRVYLVVRSSGWVWVNLWPVKVSLCGQGEWTGQVCPVAGGSGWVWVNLWSWVVDRSGLSCGRGSG